MKEHTGRSNTLLMSMSKGSFFDHSLTTPEWHTSLITHSVTESSFPSSCNNIWTWRDPWMNPAACLSPVYLYTPFHKVLRSESSLYPNHSVFWSLPISLLLTPGLFPGFSLCPEMKTHITLQKIPIAISELLLMEPAFEARSCTFRAILVLDLLGREW